MIKMHQSQANLNYNPSTLLLTDIRFKSEEDYFHFNKQNRSFYIHTFMVICKNSFVALIAFSFFFFASCSKEVVPIVPPINYLALGDSYTIGQGVDEAQRWPNQLSKKLEENGFEVTNTKIIAQTGWRTSHLMDGIAADTALTDYNLVSLLIGVNNQFWSQPFEIFSNEFDSLMDISSSLAGGKENVFVVSIPDYGVTPFGSNNSESIARDIDEYNGYINQKCIELDIPFINITEISRQLGDSTGALAPDNLHPSGTQYAAWVEEIFPIVKGLLEE